MMGYHRYRYLLLLCPPISFDHPYLHHTNFELSFSIHSIFVRDQTDEMVAFDKLMNLSAESDTQTFLLKFEELLLHDRFVPKLLSESKT